MNKRQKYLVIAFLIAVSLLFILPPIVYQYEFPTTGDDTYDHLEQMDRIESYYQQHQGEMQEVKTRYAGENFTWLLWKIASGMTGIGLDDFFVWFNWLALVVIALSLFWFGYRLFNWQAGVCIVMLAMFSARAMSDYFYNGTIYNIINFYVFILQGVLCLCLWQREKRRFWMWVSLLLFCIAGIYHSSSGMIMIAGIGVYLGSSFLWYCWKRDKGNIVRVIKYGLLFGVIVIVPALILNMEIRGLFQGVFHVGTPIATPGTLRFSPDNPIGFLQWMFKCCSPWVIPLMVLFGWILWQKKAKADWKVFGVIGGFVAVLAVGAFFPIWYDHPRFALDLGIVVAITGGCVAGLAIKARGNRIFALIIGIVILGSSMPTLWQYGHYSSTYTPADRACVEMLNSLEGSTWESSTQVQEGIYKRFVEGKGYVVEGGEYAIWRSEPMTQRTNPDNYWFNAVRAWRNESMAQDYAGMTELGHWSYKGIEVILLDTRSSQ